MTGLQRKLVPELDICVRCGIEIEAKGWWEETAAGRFHAGCAAAERYSRDHVAVDRNLDEYVVPPPVERSNGR